MNNIELEKRITEIINDLSLEKGYICSIDVLIKLNYLAQADYENWRFGRVYCLEKVCKTILNKLRSINQIMKKTSLKLNFKPSWTAYNKYGTGTKTRLRFCKSGNDTIEKAYSTHFIKVKQITDSVQK